MTIFNAGGRSSIICGPVPVAAEGSGDAALQAASYAGAASSSAAAWACDSIAGPKSALSSRAFSFRFIFTLPSPLAFSIRRRWDAKR